MEEEKETDSKEVSDALHMLLHCSLKDTEYETQKQQFEIVNAYIKQLEKENEEWQRAYQEEKDKQFELLRENKQLEEENKHYKKYAVMMTTEGLLINGVKFSFNDYIPKSKVKGIIEQLDERIKCLHEELTKCCEERDKLGTETEIDNNEVRIFTLEEEIDKLHTQKQVLQELLREE